MLDLSTENKALCFEDSTRKPLYIFLYYLDKSGTDGYDRWQYFTTIDEAIVLESAEMTEGVLEGNNFELGSFVIPSMKVQWQNNGIRYKDMVAVPVQKIGDEYIAYFDGYISSEEISQDGQTVSAEIVSFLGERLDIDVLETVKSGSGYTFYQMIQTALGKTAGIWVYGSETDELLNKFKNANTIINLNTETLPRTLTANELLKQAGEFLGAHIVVKEKRVVDIDNMKTYQPSGLPTIDFIRFANVDTVAQSNTKPLPRDYKRLPYLQFNGNQYIDTGVSASGDISAEYQVIFDEIKTYQHILSAEHLYFPHFRKADDIYTKIDWNWVGKSPAYTSAKNFYRKTTFSAFNNNKVVVNGQEYSAAKGTTTPNGNLYLGTYGGDPDNQAYTFNGKFFYCKIFDNNVLVRDFVPCVRTSDNKCGIYDLANGVFYISNSGYDFISTNAIETYTLPYYINLYADKTNRVNFGGIRVVTKSGEQLNYTINLKDNAPKTYEIKDNIFFEALSTQYWEYCSNAVGEVGSYLAEQNLYYADLQTVYPPFVEAADYLIVKGKNQNKLPSGYHSLDYVEIKKETAPYLTGIVTNVLPDSNNIEIDIDFSFNSNDSVIFEADAIDDIGTILMLHQFYGTLNCYIGNFFIGDVSGVRAFQIPYAPKNQKLNLKIRCGNGRYEYNGSFSGNGLYHGDDVIYTQTNEIILGTTYGRNVDFKLYHFAYSQDGVKLCDMYPCMRQSDGAIGVYDIVQNAFRIVEGNPSPNYESADIVIPTLSITSKGIHSMRADILCKATNTNKN